MTLSKFTEFFSLKSASRGLQLMAGPQNQFIHCNTRTSLKQDIKDWGKDVQEKRNYAETLKFLCSFSTNMKETTFKNSLLGFFLNLCKKTVS